MKPLPISDLTRVVAATRRHWDALPAGTAFFFTGGTGFVGRWLLESLLLASDVTGKGFTATVLTRDPAGFRERCPHLVRRPDLTLWPGSPEDFEFPPGKFPFIIHAALGDAVLGTLRVLAFAHHAASAQILFTSSGAVYGEQRRDLSLQPETPAPIPRDDYGRGKATAEGILRDYSEEHGYAVKIARLFAFIGPGLPLDAHYAAGHFMADALAGSPLRVLSDGTAVRGWMYAADMAEWLWTILFAGQSGRAYNVGSDYPLSVASLARSVSIVAANPPLPVEILGPPDPNPLPARYVPDVTRARTELDLITAFTPIPEAIRSTLEWHRANK